MRKILTYSLIGLFLGVGIVALIEIDPGYVLIAYASYTVETSLWVATLVLALFTGLVYLIIRLWRKFWGSKRFYDGWRGSRKAKQGARLTNRGLINFIEGNWSKSRKQLLRGAKGNEAPLLNYLMAARASYQLNEADKMREYLGVAESSEADAGIAVELTQAEMMSEENTSPLSRKSWSFVSASRAPSRLPGTEGTSASSSGLRL